MKNVLIIGAGKIGSAAAELLIQLADGKNLYNVTLADVSQESLKGKKCHEWLVLDVNDNKELKKHMQMHDVVLSALSLDKNLLVAEVALKYGLSYFDLSEDVHSAMRIEAMAANAKEGQYFVPQCGLAPGFISIMAADLIEQFDTVEEVMLRVGSLPKNPTNALKYNIMWSVDGLINEYTNPCQVVRNGKIELIDPLSYLEHHMIDEMLYEAFTTSGGVGTLCSTYNKKAKNINYKTLRYQGHLDLMRFLMHDMKLGQNHVLLKQILIDALPETDDDVVVAAVFATGYDKNRYCCKQHIVKVFGKTGGCTAIQAATAGSACAVIELITSNIINDMIPDRGLIKQEDIPWDVFNSNRFAKAFITES